MFCIGEIADHSSIISGIVCQPRKSGDRIAIWLGKGTKEQIMEIGNKIKECCNYEDKIKYDLHPKG